MKRAITTAVSAAALAAATVAQTGPVIPRLDTELPQELPRGAEIPEGLDPLADGILMAHQVSWLEDRSDLKVCKKGRRTGITFAEALDDTLIAASARSAGGDNVFYIGDTKDKGREFIRYVAHFAKVVAKEAGQVEEFLFEDQREDGSSKHISAYRVTFASGWGARISEIKLSQEWYRENGTPYIEAFGDRSVEIAGDEDVIRDHQALQYVNGVVKVPDDMRYKGGDGLDRHGDTGIAGMLAWYASRQGAVTYGYEPVTAFRTGARGSSFNTPDDDETGVRDPYASPLGAHLRTGGLT